MLVSGYHSQYSDLLGAGLSGDRTLKGVDFPHSSSLAVIQLEQMWLSFLTAENSVQQQNTVFS